MNWPAWIQRWIHTYEFWHMISRYSSWSWIHIWIHIMNSYKISWSWIHMWHFMTYEFIYEFMYMKNIVKSYLNSGVSRFQMGQGGQRTFAAVLWDPGTAAAAAWASAEHSMRMSVNLEAGGWWSPTVSMCVVQKNKFKFLMSHKEPLELVEDGRTRTWGSDFSELWEVGGWWRGRNNLPKTGTSMWLGEYGSVPRPTV